MTDSYCALKGASKMKEAFALVTLEYRCLEGKELVKFSVDLQVQAQVQIYWSLGVNENLSNQGVGVLLMSEAVRSLFRNIPFQLSTLQYPQLCRGQHSSCLE